MSVEKNQHIKFFNEKIDFEKFKMPDINMGIYFEKFGLSDIINLSESDRTNILKHANDLFNVRQDDLGLKRFSSILFTNSISLKNDDSLQVGAIGDLFNTNKELGGVAIGLLVSDPDPEIRMQTLRQISRSMPRIAVEYLVSAIESDPDVDIRIKSFDILCSLDHKRAEDVGNKLLNDPTTPEPLVENIVVLLQEEPFVIVDETLTSKNFEFTFPEFIKFKEITERSRMFLSNQNGVIERVNAFKSISADFPDSGINLALCTLLTIDRDWNSTELGTELLREMDPEFAELVSHS